MGRFATFIMLCWMPVFGLADGRSMPFQEIVAQDILPGFEALSRKAAILADAAETSCDAEDLRRVYAEAFQAWTLVSHLRFGPSEEENRAFSLAFWPDPRGKMPKALRKLLLQKDPDALSPEAYSEASIAARGFYALDYLLFDPEFAVPEDASYHCAVIGAVARDIDATAKDLNNAWRQYALALTSPTPDTPYRTDEEVLQVLFKSASTGLQFTDEMRLGPTAWHVRKATSQTCRGLAVGSKSGVDPASRERQRWSGVATGSGRCCLGKAALIMR